MKVDYWKKQEGNMHRSYQFIKALEKIGLCTHENRMKAYKLRFSDEYRRWY